MPHNPFDKPLGAPLTPDDFQLLVTGQVAEGYVVEYKSYFPSREKIGHSIAALGNTIGGWLFIGLETHGTVATKIVGLDPARHPDPVSTVRDMVKSQVDPYPVLHPQVTVLPNSRLVLTVYVPPNQETPFITRDGRIYRRQVDSSEPVHETDRYALDRLVDRGREARSHFLDFCTDERAFSQAEADEGQAWLQLFLFPYPEVDNQERRGFTIIDMRAARDLSRRSVTIFPHSVKPITGNISFNHIQPGDESIVLRQVQPSAIASNCMTAYLYSNGAAKFFLPIKLESRGEPPVLTSSLMRKTFADTWNKDETEEAEDLWLLKFFDTGWLWLRVAAFMSFYREWLGPLAIGRQLRVGIVMNDVWRHVPTADSDDWAKHVSEFGFPVVPFSEIDLLSMGESGLTLDLDQEEIWWTRVCTAVGNALGCAY